MVVVDLEGELASIAGVLGRVAVMVARQRSGERGREREQVGKCACERETSRASGGSV